MVWRSRYSVSYRRTRRLWFTSGCIKRPWSLPWKLWRTEKIPMKTVQEQSGFSVHPRSVFAKPALLMNSRRIFKVLRKVFMFLCPWLTRRQTCWRSARISFWNRALCRSGFGRSTGGSGFPSFASGVFIGALFPGHDVLATSCWARIQRMRNPCSMLLS